MTVRGLLLSFLAVAALSGAIAAPCSADLTIKTTTTLIAPQSQANSPAAAALGSVPESTTYFSGKKMRLDSPLVAMIGDMEAGTMTMLFPPKHAYIVNKFDPAAMTWMGPGKFSPSNVPGLTVERNIIDTGKTTRVLGHTARHYIMTMAFRSNDSRASFNIRSDILAAEDIDCPEYAYWFLALGQTTEANRIKGLPLLTESRITGGIMDGFVTRETVTSIAQTPVPSSVFQIPEGYSPANAPASRIGPPVQ